MSRRPLILYATPTGALGEACDEYFTAVGRIGSTRAQAFPPHCTLTGFFHRSGNDAAAVIGEVRGALDEIGPVPDDAVDVIELSVEADWIGLVLRSPWLLIQTARVIERISTGPEEDPLRPKVWLHLSLAYGEAISRPGALDAYATLARDLVDPAATAGWELALWERLAGGGWNRH